MSVFLGAAREQVARILEYLAVTGGAALVDLTRRTIESQAGKVDTAGVARVFELELDSGEEPVHMDDSWIVGRLGGDHALVLVLELDQLGSSRHAAVERFKKASRLLSWMIQPVGRSTFRPLPGSGSNGGTGSPAEVRVFWEDQKDKK